MQWESSTRGQDYYKRLTEFMDESVYPAEKIYDEQMALSGDPHTYPDVLHELKAEARDRGLWNLFLPDKRWGAGLSNRDYAPMAELMGHSLLAPEACNCSAPDTGNMEILALFGTQEQQSQWLKPLLSGTMRSSFGMTEPNVASSDAQNIQLSIRRDGDHYVLNGRKWWTTGVMHPLCRVLIVMGKSDPDAPPHRQQSMIIVPLQTPGLTIVRDLPLFGHHAREGHGELLFEDVRVPATNMLGAEGDGFAIAQARLGPGRIHHAMRAIGSAERALSLMCSRAASRTTFGSLVSERSNIQDWIAESRVDIEMLRLLTLKAAWMMDTVGNKAARMEIAAIKIAAPELTLRVIDRAIQVHGGGGVSEDTPLAAMFVQQRAFRLADGPDEVHKRSLALQELRAQARAIADH